MEEVTQGYQPLDLVEVQKELPKNFKKITNDSVLESEVVDICGILKDLSKFKSSKSEVTVRYFRRRLG